VMGDLKSSAKTSGACDAFRNLCRPAKRCARKLASVSVLAFALPENATAEESLGLVARLLTMASQSGPITLPDHLVRLAVYHCKTERASSLASAKLSLPAPTPTARPDTRSAHKDSTVWR